MRAAFYFCMMWFALSFWGMVAFIVPYLLDLSHIQYGFAALVCGGSFVLAALGALIVNEMTP